MPENTTYEYQWLYRSRGAPYAHLTLKHYSTEEEVRRDCPWHDLLGPAELTAREVEPKVTVWICNSEFQIFTQKIRPTSVMETDHLTFEAAKEAVLSKLTDLLEYHKNAFDEYEKKLSEARSLTQEAVERENGND